MITNFEEITKDLNPEERKLIPVLIKGFVSHDKSNPIRSEKIVRIINTDLKKYGLLKKFSGARLRKLSNLIRRNGIIPLIGTSKGYYTSFDKGEIQKQIDSLIERADAIKASADGMRKFLL